MLKAQIGKVVKSGKREGGKRKRTCGTTRPRDYRTLRESVKGDAEGAVE